MNAHDFVSIDGHPKGWIVQVWPQDSNPETGLNPETVLITKSERKALAAFVAISHTLRTWDGWE